MRVSHAPWAERALHWLAEGICRRPGWFVYPHLVLLTISLTYAVTHLEVRSNRSDLVSADADYERLWQAYRADFPLQDDLVVLVESEDPEKNRQFVERLGARLEAETNLFHNVLYRGDPRRFGPKALLFLPEEQLRTMAMALREYGPLVAAFRGVTNLQSLLAEVNTRLRAIPPDQASHQPLSRALTPLTRMLTQASASLERSGMPPSPGWSSLFAETSEGAAREYLHLARGRIYLVACAPRDASNERLAIQRLREIVQDTAPEVPGVNAGVTGEAVLRWDEVAQAKRDTLLASVVSLVLVAILFAYGYHEIARPLLATACLVVGIAYTLAFAALTVGQLNILTITFVPILIGLSIDFSVHLITRFEEELRLGADKARALRKALIFAGGGILTSGLTTATAFLAVAVTGFKGIREMGIISGGGMLLCLVPMMTLLPALLLASEKDTMAPSPLQVRRRASRERWEEQWLARPRVVLVAGMVVTAAAAALLPSVRFDYNLLNLQSPNLPAVVLEKKLIEASPKSLLHCVLTVPTAAEAVRMEDRLLSLPSVAAVESLGRLLTENPARKLQWIREIQRGLEPLGLPPPDDRPVVLTGLVRELDALTGFARLAGGVMQRQGDARLADRLRGLAQAGASLRYNLHTQPPFLAQGKLTAFQQAFFRDLNGTAEALKRQDTRQGLRLGDLPSAVRDRFIGRSGRFLVRVYPRENVWEREHQTTFVSELRTVAPEVTGSPVRFYEYTSMLKRSSQQAAGYATVAVCLMVLLHLRSPMGAVLALLPVLLGMVWMAAVMALLDLPFNPANIMSLTLLIGIGVTNGIHILARFREEKHPAILAKSTGKAVMVSALTTMAGFGSLMLARHQGIASLGQIMTLGTGLCMLASLTVLPALLTLLDRLGWKLRHR